MARLEVGTEPCKVEYMGAEIHGRKCKRDKVFYHRTDLKSLKKIVSEGMLKPSEETELTYSSH